MAFWSSQEKKKNKLKSSNKKLKTKVSPYHCVEISMHYDACDAAMNLHGKRFLSSEAPDLPLPECDQTCACKFKHHNDRRQDERRDVFSSGGIHYNGDKNRRLGGDRRRQTHAKAAY